MTITIAYFDAAADVIEHFTGADLPEAAEKLAAGLGCDDLADWVHNGFIDVFRDVDPDKYWLAMLGHVIGENDDWAYGATAAEADAGLMINQIS